MRLQVTGHNQYVFQIGGSKLAYKLFNLLGFLGRYWFLGLGLVLAIIGLAGSSILPQLLPMATDYWIVTGFFIIVGFILSWKFEIRPGWVVMLLGILSIVPLAALIFGLDFVAPSLQITDSSGNPVIFNSEQLFLLAFLVEALIMVMLIIFLNPPPLLLLDPITRELNIRDERYFISNDALIQINRKTWSKRSGNTESVPSYHLEWKLFITQLEANDNWIKIPLYKIERSSSAIFMLRYMLVNSNSKKWDGWIMETAEQLRKLLDLEIRKNLS
ncbi:MAG: hypothetical protein ACW98I_15160 [Candidatus Hodarchaeales archaeon]|jgi:hypothetical protein